MSTKFNQPRELDVEQLLLDSRNPRIPPEKRSLSQPDLAVYIAEQYFALSVARSIATHEFFPSEPLIAIPSGESDRFIVVEGNRRLSALKILLSISLRSKLKSRAEWDKLPTGNVPSRVPVVVVKDRKEVAPIIGYRHISGIQPWDAHAKARYIAEQVDSGLTFAETAGDVGETETDVKMNYRNYRISEQASKLPIPSETLAEMESGFGVFTRAMQSASVRDFLGAPSSDKVVITKPPISSSKSGALKEVVEMLFGPKAVLTDSRDITKLGKVLASEEGLKSLRKDRNLTEALVASGGIRDRLVSRLTTAGKNLRAARDDLPAYKKDKDVRILIEEAAGAITDLQSVK